MKPNIGEEKGNEVSVDVEIKNGDIEMSSKRLVPKAEDVEVTIHGHKHERCRTKDGKMSGMTQEEKDKILQNILDPDEPMDFTVIPYLDDVQLAQLIDMIQPTDIPVLIQKFRKVVGVRRTQLKKDLTFRNISYRKGEITYLSGVSGYVKASTMTCVLGAPDAGVTTLFKTLAGRASMEAVVSGEILLDGTHVDESYGQHVGFIPKDDLHYPTLTVRETLRMSIRMRFGYNDLIDDIFKKFFVEIILKLVGLGGNIANTIIGDDTHRGISGGQKRRVSIATEIVAGHNIILADLLTNGLDSKTAYDLTHQMRTVSRAKGESKSFMISLVQPSPELFNLFDNLLLLSKGRCVYFGPLRDKAGGYPVLDFLGSLGFAYPKGKSIPDYLAEVSSNPVKFHKSRIPRVQLKNGDFTLIAEKCEEKKGDKTKKSLIQKHAKIIADLQHALDKTAVMGHELENVDEIDEEKVELIGQGDTERGPVKIRGLSLPNNVAMEATESGSQLPVCEVQENEREVGYMYLIKSYKESQPYRRLGEELWLEFEEKMPWEITKNIPKFTTSWFYQTFECLKREWIVKIRDMQTIIGKIFQQVLVAVILGTVFLDLGNTQGDADARVGFIFIIVLQNVFGTTEDVPDIMAKKRVFYAQEAAGYYHGSAFFVAQQLIKIPFTLLYVFIYILIIYPMTGLQGGAGSQEFWYLYGLAIMGVLTSQAWVLFVCAMAPNEVAAQAGAPVGLVIFMIHCGFLISTEDIPVYLQWVSTISFLTYLFRGAMLNEFDGLELKCDSDELVPPSSVPNFEITPPNGFNGVQVCPFTSGNEYLQIYDMEGFDPDHEKNQVLYYLIAFITVFNVMAFWALVIKPHELGDQEEPPRFEKEAIKKEAKVTESEEKEGNEKKKKHVSYIEWKNLTYEVVNRKDKSQRITLLNKVAGYAAPGDMVALMGPSGAGKSTLLDVIAGKKSTGFITGDILVNGKPADEFFPRMAGYVEQFDSHVEFATVEESVYFSAQLRLETDDEAEIKREVEHAMESVGINHVRSDMIGNLESGGISPELRKKTAIAVELVMRPTILFLDEPTTGLDSVSAMAVVDTVSDLAKRGLAVICTIHQPSAELFSRFARILILQPFRAGEERGGRVSYFGNVSMLKDYCSDMKLGKLEEGRNIADFALEALGGPREQPDGKVLQPAEVFLESKIWSESKVRLDDGVFATAKKKNPGIVVPEYTSVFAKGPWSQFKTVMVRSYYSTIRDVDTLRSQVGAIVFMGIVIGILFWQQPNDQSGATNRVSIFFLCLMFINFSHSYKINLLVGSRASFFRESTSNMYRGWVFYVTQTCADAITFIPRASLFSIMIYFFTGLSLDNGGVHFWIFLVIINLIFLQALTFAELFSFCLPNVQLGQGIFTLTLTIQSLFAGFLVRESNIPEYWVWLYYINGLRYPLFALTRNELAGLEVDCPNNEGAVPVGPLQSSYTDTSNNTIICDASRLGDANCFINICPVTSGDDILERFDMTESVGFYIGISVTIIVGVRCLNVILFSVVNWVEK